MEEYFPHLSKKQLKSLKYNQRLSYDCQKILQQLNPKSGYLHHPRKTYLK